MNSNSKSAPTTEYRCTITAGRDRRHIARRQRVAILNLKFIFN